MSDIRAQEYPDICFTSLVISFSFILTLQHDLLAGQLLEVLDELLLARSILLLGVDHLL